MAAHARGTRKDAQNLDILHCFFIVSAATLSKAFNIFCSHFSPNEAAAVATDILSPLALVHKTCLDKMRQNRADRKYASADFSERLRAHHTAEPRRTL